MNVSAGTCDDYVRNRRLRANKNAYKYLIPTGALENIMCRQKKSRSTIHKNATLTEDETLSAISNGQQDISDKRVEATKISTKSGEDYRDILLLQQQLREKTDKIDELQKDIENIVELFKKDIYNKMQLYNIEMIFGFLIIAISLLLYQSLSLLLLFFTTGIGIIATSYMSKKKIIKISRDIGEYRHE